MGPGSTLGRRHRIIGIRGDQRGPPRDVRASFPRDVPGDELTLVADTHGDRLVGHAPRSDSRPASEIPPVGRWRTSTGRVTQHPWSRLDHPRRDRLPGRRRAASRRTILRPGRERGQPASFQTISSSPRSSRSPRRLRDAVRNVVPRDVVPDMPDRIIAATALYLGLPLVTRDSEDPCNSRPSGHDLVTGPDRCLSLEILAPKVVLSMLDLKCVLANMRRPSSRTAAIETSRSTWLIRSVGIRGLRGEVTEGAPSRMWRRSAGASKTSVAQATVSIEKDPDA